MTTVQYTYAKHSIIIIYVGTIYAKHYYETKEADVKFEENCQFY